ncbi:hypothetical protein [Porphyrobacter sp. GA68]|uniref:hypothetical protein n=1 Tax=Porphyrobacter sp. GA68 TaxID=2883480 RepID=UPI001D18F670|nr:hypothetical protein [Porphyrobacter sp. GA68]
MRTAQPAFYLAFALTACSPTAEQETASQAAEPEAGPTASPAPDDFANTAWRSTAENGTVFVTYLDQGGTYRDLRNGDPYQTGTWVFGDDGQLCLTPDLPEAQGGCWTPGQMRSGDLLTLRSEGKRIQVRRITYEPPAPAQDTEAAEG